MYLPFYKNFMVRDKLKYNEICKLLLDEWHIETLVPAHGDILRGEKLVREVLERHLTLD